MIIGTAGHVDHGKTTLVRALTGVDTDRLPEEKARGISIALGYAYSPLPNGAMLGFVDVPGHERFLPTMLAGATGIDYALLVVAADDGVMPQTREHLDILSLLGVSSGAIALTKMDCMVPARLEALQTELGDLLAGSALAQAPIFPLSAATGAGVAALRAHLHAQALAWHRRELPGYFRLAVDRSFTLPGIGTVVTGTAHSGRVAEGDHVAVAPAGIVTRVRSIHAQDRPSAEGLAGQRCALNLAGIAREQVRRGDWIVAPEAVLSSQRCDVRCTILAHAPALRSGSTVQLHVGAAQTTARVVVLAANHERDASDRGASAPGPALQAEVIEPGESGLVQLILQQAVALWHGDHLIMRDAAAARTLGGGRVLDPMAPARYRRTPERLAELAALETWDAGARLGRLIELSPAGIDLSRFAVTGNGPDLAALVLATGARRVRASGADYAVGMPHWDTLQDRIVAALGGFHRDHPDDAGPDRNRLQRMALPRLPAALAAALLGDLLATGRILAAGPWLHLPGYGESVSVADQALLRCLLPRLAAAPYDPPWVRELAVAEGVGEAHVRGALVRAGQRAEVFPVVRDLFYCPAAIRDLAAIARHLHVAEGEVRAAAFRDATGLGRKRAIQVLEFFDRIGLLRRVRDRHLLRSESPLDRAVTQAAAGKFEGDTGDSPVLREPVQELH